MPAMPSDPVNWEESQNTGMVVSTNQIDSGDGGLKRWERIGSGRTATRRCRTAAERHAITEAEAAKSPHRNVITRAVGGEDELFVEVRLFELGHKDRILLCSDGLYKEVAFDEIREITGKTLDAESQEPQRKPVGMPVMLKRLPEGSGGISDVHRFWEQTGSFYIGGQGNENLADPFIGLGVMPACSGVFRDMTQIRFKYPEYKPENCTACGDCFTICPDSAIPGLVNSVEDVFTTAISRIETGGQPTLHLRRAVRDVEKRLRTLIEPLGDRIGPVQLQLPPSFGPESAPTLRSFVARLPAGYRWMVELRHAGFFDGSPVHRAADRFLDDAGVGRVVLDTRPPTGGLVQVRVLARDDHQIGLARRRTGDGAKAVQIGPRAAGLHEFDATAGRGKGHGPK
mgnify:CR=1 FL=1